MKYFLKYLIKESIIITMKQKTSPTQKALNLWAIILIIWAVYRANFKMPEVFDEFIAKPLVFILPVYYYIKKIEKKKFFEALLIKPKLFLGDLLLGILIGGLFFLMAILANFLKAKQLFFINTFFNLGHIGVIFATTLATGISEEILSRGFILKRLYDDSKNIFTASFFASILFFFLHVPILFTNQKIIGNLLLVFMATDLILSLVNSFIFLIRKSLTLPIFIHAFYNLSILLFV